MNNACQVVRRQVEISNAYGFHMRPAKKFVTIARQYQSEIRVRHNGREFDGKSILDLITLAAPQGTMLEVEARGADAELVLAALCNLIRCEFFEDDEGQERPPDWVPPNRQQSPQANGSPSQSGAAVRDDAQPSGPER